MFNEEFINFVKEKINTFLQNLVQNYIKIQKLFKFWNKFLLFKFHSFDHPIHQIFQSQNTANFTMVCDVDILKNLWIIYENLLIFPINEYFTRWQFCICNTFDVITWITFDTIEWSGRSAPIFVIFAIHTS